MELILVPVTMWHYINIDNMHRIKRIKETNQLTEIGFTIELICDGYKSHTFQIVASDMGSTVIHVQIEGTLDGENWFNLAKDRESLIIPTNGAYMLTYDCNILKARGRLVQKAKGSDAKIDVKYFGK